MDRRGHVAHLGIACLVAIGGIVAVPYPAAADDGPASGVSQYVETIPTSGGSQKTGAGTGLLATADDGPASGVSQYVETIPTSGGSQKTGAGTASTSTLPPSAKTALANVDPVLAEELTKIATSPAYGAPAASSPKPSPPGGTTSTQAKARSTEVTSVSTLGVVGSDAPLAIGLATILGFITLALILASRSGRQRVARR